MADGAHEPLLGNVPRRKTVCNVIKRWLEALAWQMRLAFSTADQLIVLDTLEWAEDCIKRNAVCVVIIAAACDSAVTRADGRDTSPSTCPPGPARPTWAARRTSPEPSANASPCKWRAPPTRHAVYTTTG